MYCEKGFRITLTSTQVEEKRGKPQCQTSISQPQTSDIFIFISTFNIHYLFNCEKQKMIF